MKPSLPTALSPRSRPRDRVASVGRLARHIGAGLLFACNTGQEVRQPAPGSADDFRLRARLTAESHRESSHDPRLSLLLAAHAARIEERRHAGVDGSGAMATRQTLIDALLPFRGPMRRFEGFTDPVFSLWRSGDGGHLAALSAGHRLKCWTVVQSPDGVPLPPRLASDLNDVFDVAFSADGEWFAVAHVPEGDPEGPMPPGDVQVYRLHHPEAQPAYLSLPRWVGAVAFDPLSKWIATGAGDGIVRLWRLRDIAETSAQSEAIIIGSHTLPITALAYSPDGRWLLSDGRDGSVKLWRVDPPQGGFTAAAAATIDSHLEIEAAKILFSSDAHWAAVLWPYGRGLQLVDLRADSPTWVNVAGDAKLAGAAFSVDGHWLVAETYEGELRTRPLVGPGGWSARARLREAIYQLEFSADGRWLIGVGSDRVYMVPWVPLLAGEPFVPLVVSVPSSRSLHAALSADGQFLFAGDESGSLYVAALGWTPLLALARDAVHRNLTLQEWNAHAGPSPYVKAFPDLDDAPGESARR